MPVPLGNGIARHVAPAARGRGNLPIVSRSRAPRIEETAVHRRTQQIMLRRRFKTVESYRAAAVNRDNPHFGDA
ncbi:hypothetical protein [Burkholderia pseudomultivorans]|uniref:hypothetical protein n=1 Tax=Burkholderia pseudomultivorans TaxID=1207504 RepID=UPI000757E02A|nr:hypothetical protein [Burkholderia pseudomultivorans]KVG61935.1 hypothetical protein WS80_26785 [Burkholderia pseudomultivorans]